MAAQSAQVTVVSRSELGSRANKRLRDAGKLPGVIYGHKEAVIPVTLPKKEVIGHLNRGAHVFDLHFNGQSQKVLVKDVQYDHLGMDVLHVDFARVSLDEKVEVTVPLELRGTPKGEADGGVLQQIIKALEIECLVTDIPEIVRYSVADMALDSVLHIKDLILPPGVKVLQDGELIVATVKEIQEIVETPATAAAEGESTEPELIRKPGAEEGEADAAAAPGAEKKAEKK